MRSTLIACMSLCSSTFYIKRPLINLFRLSICWTIVSCEPLVQRPLYHKMVSRNTVLVLTALLGCLALQVGKYWWNWVEIGIIFWIWMYLQGSATVVDDVLCHDWQHHTFGAGISCCNHKTVHPGISENMDYKEWQDAPKDDKENLTASTVNTFISRKIPNACL